MLCVLELYGRNCQRRVVYRLQGTCSGTGVIVQDVRDDRMARGFCAWTEGDHCGDEQVAVSKYFQHGEYGPEGIDCRGQRLAGVRGGDAGRLYQAAGPGVGGFCDYPGPDLHSAARRFLCLSECEPVYRQEWDQVGDRSGGEVAERGACCCGSW